MIIEQLHILPVTISKVSVLYVSGLRHPGQFGVTARCASALPFPGGWRCCFYLSLLTVCPPLSRNVRYLLIFITKFLFYCGLVVAFAYLR